MHNIPPQPSGWPVIGHDQPIGILRRSLRTDRLSHAYLFTGPEGIGKRTVAITLALTVNCVGEVPAGQPWPEVPCLLCPSCARIMRGAHPDVAEISLETQAHLQGDSGKKGAPARELRIDVVRDMQASIGLNPYSARRKVYLIGDADRLNEEASNCLLKTLEEPPEHSMLVLMSPDEESVLPTISSRCMQLQFRPLSKKLVASSLASIWGAEEELAERLAALSGGRWGYGVGLLGNELAVTRRRS
ncbi:MAG: polymerase subunit delta, partial [Chloroflexia bacterium]|nr:polymerase subunit delta [Chloroflexia bacterium]